MPVQPHGEAGSNQILLYLRNKLEGLIRNRRSIRSTRQPNTVASRSIARTKYNLGSLKIQVSEGSILTRGVLENGPEYHAEVESEEVLVACDRSIAHIAQGVSAIQSKRRIDRRP